MSTADTPLPIKVIESAVESRHVVELTYVARDGLTVQMSVEPLAIRYNSAKHRVLWVWNLDAGHLEQLLLSGIADARDTGRTFPVRSWSEPPR